MPRLPGRFLVKHTEQAPIRRRWTMKPMTNLGSYACGCTACSDQVREATAVTGSDLRPGAILRRLPGDATSCVDPRTQAPTADWMDRAVPESHAIGPRGET